MKIAVIENQRVEIEGVFNYANFKYYDNLLEIKYFETAQAFLREINFEEFDVISVDIELSLASSFDGYGLIKKVLEINPKLKEKIIILTGHHKIEEKLAEYSLPQIPIILKPTDFKTVYQHLKDKGLKGKE